MIIKNIIGKQLKEVVGNTLCGANLRGANLREANLYGADLYGADLCEADLYGADLYGVNLRKANLYRADLCEADLRGANLHEADLCEAKVEYTKWPSPTMVLLADWSNVSSKLCKSLMRFDAFNHPRPKDFIKWKDTGNCPYENQQFERSANFSEEPTLITKDFLRLKVYSAYELMQMLLKEKCITK